MFRFVILPLFDLGLTVHGFKNTGVFTARGNSSVYCD